MIYYGIKQNQGFNQFNSKIKERKKIKRRYQNEKTGIRKRYGSGNKR